jgi:hypothetical protein
MKGSNLFTWNNNVCSDDCWKKAKDHNNTQINNYMLFDTNFVECKAPNVQMPTFYFDHVNLRGRSGYGLSDDCLIDNYSKLRNDTSASTRTRCPVQLLERTFQSPPSLLRGKGDISKELDVLSGSDTNYLQADASCKKSIMEKQTYHNIPLLDVMSDIQNPNNIVMDKPIGDDTRSYINRQKFVNNCRK